MINKCLHFWHGGFSSTFVWGRVVNLFNDSSLGRSAISELPCCSLCLMALGRQWELCVIAALCWSHCSMTCKTHFQSFTSRKPFRFILVSEMISSGCMKSRWCKNSFYLFIYFVLILNSFITTGLCVIN